MTPLARLRLFPVYRVVLGVLPILLGGGLVILGVSAGRARDVALALGVVLLGVSKLLHPTPMPLGSEALSPVAAEARQRRQQQAAVGPAGLAKGIEMLGFILVLVAGALALSRPL